MLPSEDLVADGIGDLGDRLGAELGADRRREMMADVTDRHPARVQRHDDRVEPIQATGALRNQHRRESPVAITGDRQLDIADFARHGFRERAVTRVRELRRVRVATVIADMVDPQAWASHKSFKPKDDQSGDGPAGRNAEVQWHGQKRSNDTHASTTDPEARWYRKSNNTAATGYAERDCATEMLKRLTKHGRPRTVAGDKNYDTKGFVADVRAAGFSPHVAQNTTNRRSPIDGRTTRHAGYDVSQRIRKRVEEPFGWARPSGPAASFATSANNATGPGPR